MFWDVNSKNYHQAIQPYCDVENEYYSYDMTLNTAGMGQDNMIYNADAVKILQSCTLPLVYSRRRMHDDHAIHSQLRYCSYQYMSII